MNNTLYLCVVDDTAELMSYMRRQQYSSHRPAASDTDSKGVDTGTHQDEACFPVHPPCQIRPSNHPV